MSADVVFDLLLIAGYLPDIAFHARNMADEAPCTGRQEAEPVHSAADPLICTTDLAGVSVDDGASLSDIAYRVSAAGGHSDMANGGFGNTGHVWMPGVPGSLHLQRLTAPRAL